MCYIVVVVSFFSSSRVQTPCSPLTTLSFRRPTMDQKDVDMKASKVFYGPTNASRVVDAFVAMHFVFAFFASLAMFYPQNSGFSQTTPDPMMKALMQPMQFGGRLLSYAVLVSSQ